MVKLVIAHSQANDPMPRVEAPLADQAGDSPELAEILQPIVAMLDQATDAIFVVDSQLRVGYWNDAAARLTGHPPAVMVGGALAGFADDRLGAEVERVLAGQPGNVAPIAATVSASRGDRIAVAASVSPVVGGQHSVRGAWVTCRDDRARTRELTVLRDQEALFRLLIERLPALTYLHRPEGGLQSTGLLQLGARFEELTGYPMQAWLDDPAFTYKIMHPDDRERLLESDREADRRGDPYTAEYRLIANDGRIVWVRDDAVLIHDDTGQRKFWLGLLVDISALKHAEADTATALANVRAVNRELARVSEARAKFFAVISHEFRTPLTSIQGYSELLADEILPSDVVRQYAQTINLSAMRLSRMIEVLLELDQLDSGLVDRRDERVNLNAVVNEVLTLLRPTLADHLVETRFDPAEPEVRGDIDLLVRVLTNLVSNAAKYSRSGSTITVTTERRPDGVAAIVRDQGIGIPGDQLERIFSRYIRLQHQEQRGIVGNGLGLPIARQIAELHGGTLTAASDQEGSWFTLQLPLPDAAPIPGSAPRVTRDER